MSAAQERLDPDLAIIHRRGRRSLEVADQLQPATAGAELLERVEQFLADFIAFPSEHSQVAVTLWAAHTHAVEHFHTTPRLALLSPEAGSGKTRVLDVLHLLTHQPEFVLNASPAAIFRMLDQATLTLLVDEADAIWQRRGKDGDGNEDLRALLNAGYRRGASIPRCVGPKHEVQRFTVYCPVALAGLGDLPETIMTRSIIIRMRRRAPSEQVGEFRHRVDAPEGHALRDELAAWMSSVGEAVGEAWPELPAGVTDRPAELWEPLLAIADAAGGHWPVTARAACLALCRVAEDRQVTLGVRLLADIRRIFGNADALATETILERLTSGVDLEPDAPWGDLKGKPIGVRGLATMLGRYGIKPRKVRETGGKPLQGYRREELYDAWERYLPPTPQSPEHPEQPAQPSNGAASSVPHSVPDVPGSGTGPEPSGPAMAGGALDVPHVPHSQGWERQVKEWIHEAADEVGIPADLLRTNLSDVDLADRDLLSPAWLRQYARTLRA